MFGLADDELFKLLLDDHPYLLCIKNHLNKTVFKMAYAAIKDGNINPSEENQLKNTIELLEDYNYKIQWQIFNFIKRNCLIKNILSKDIV